MAKKPIQYVKCPRCDLNYIPKSEKYCNVCKRELGLIVPDEDDITDLELCPICKTNFVQGDEEICASCKAERGIKFMDEGEDEEDTENWHKYVADDEEEDDDEYDG